MSKSIGLNYWAAVILSGASLLGTAGCSSMGGKFAGLHSSDKSRDGSATWFGKSSGHPAPGSLAGAATVPEQSKPINDESRANVALAMGEMLEQTGNLSLATEKYEQAVKTDPKSLKASLALAHAYGRSGRTESALRVYQAAEKYHRKIAALHNDRGLLLAEQKDWSGAAGALKTAVKLEPSSSKFHNNLGMVLAMSGDYEAAWKEFSEAVGPGTAHYNVALMMIQAGKMNEARDHLSRAIAIMPSLKEAQAAVAQLNGPAAPRDAAPDRTELQVADHLQSPTVALNAIEAVGDETTESSVSDAAPEVPENSDTPIKHDDPWAKPRVQRKWLR